MKVLLINPSWRSLKTKEGSIFNRVWFPLALANTAALLEKEGIEAGILDVNALRLTPEKISKEAERFDKIFISSCSIDRWQCPYTDLRPFLEVIDAVKKKNNEIYILGPHGTLRPKEMLKLTQAKAVIRGEPELTVREICIQESLHNVKGITYEEDGAIHSKEAQNLLNMNDLPMPAFHLLPINLYSYEVLGNRFILLEGSRGCPFNCIFCLKAMYGAGYRKKGAEKLIGEVEYAIANFNVSSAYFIDLEFTLNRNLVQELCEHLIGKDYDFKWCCQTRLDTVDKELLTLMKKAKCQLIHFGVETGSSRVNALLNKNITLEKIEEQIRLVQNVGIDIACFFMFGLPQEAEQDIRETIRFARHLNPTYASFHVAQPYPGTGLCPFVEDGNSIDSSNFFPEAYIENFPLERLRKINKQAFLKFYLSPRYIKGRIWKREWRSLYQQIKLYLSYFK